MSAIETLLRTAWEAGYESAPSDVPKDREFESFMERFIEEITGPEPEPTPQVDWSQAPEWANYWAMDRDGGAYWHSQEPKCRTFVAWWQEDSDDGRLEKAPSFGWPKDQWKESLVKRPQAEESASDDLKKQIAWLKRDMKRLERKLLRLEGEQE